MKIINCDVGDVTTGDNVRVMTPANIYECKLQYDVFIGYFVLLVTTSHLPTICPDVARQIRIRAVGLKLTLAIMSPSAAARRYPPTQYARVGDRCGKCGVGARNDERDLCWQSGPAYQNIVKPWTGFNRPKVLQINLRIEQVSVNNGVIRQHAGQAIQFM